MSNEHEVTQNEVPALSDQLGAAPKQCGCTSCILKRGTNAARTPMTIETHAMRSLRHEATITSESCEPKAKADSTAEGRALNPESPDRSASSDGGLMTPNAEVRR